MDISNQSAHKKDKSLTNSILEKVELLNFQQSKTKQKIDEMKYLKKREEFIECTFKPKINKKSVDIAKKVKEPINFLKKAYEQMELEKFEKQSKLQIQKAEKNYGVLEDFNKECTFYPNINKARVNLMKENRFYPKDFEKSVGRIRFAYDEKVKRQNQLDFIPTGEFLEFHRSLPMNPPKCAENYIVRTQEPFVYLNVNLKNGKKGKIAIREDDIPSAKAEEFATEFQLDGEEQEQLKDMIEDYLREHLINKN